MNEQEYIDYFEGLASSHTAFLHSPQTPCFYVVHDDNRTELEQNVRTKLKHYPVLLLDQYYDKQDRSNDNFRATIMGGLSVLVKCDGKDQADIRRARAEARTLALSFINRMYRDVRDSQTAIGKKRIQPSMEWEGEPAPMLAGMATGWGYPFEWTLPTSVAVNAQDWTDLS